jgi:hypothetical protein
VSDVVSDLVKVKPLGEGTKVKKLVLEVAPNQVLKVAKLLFVLESLNVAFTTHLHVYTTH